MSREKQLYAFGLVPPERPVRTHVVVKEHERRLPRVRGQKTSAVAATSMETPSGGARRKVLDYLLSVGRRGATGDEIEEAIDIKHQTLGPRLRELVAQHRVVDSGERRPTRSRRPAIVWIAIGGHNDADSCH
jgi:hypothetical protein